jgi:hypothetical protein
MTEKDLKKHTVVLMIVTALFFDLLQWLLAFVVMDWLVGIVACPVFVVWFWFYGVKFVSPKRLATLGGTFIIEAIPLLSTLPVWTGAVVVIILDHKAKRLLASKALQPTLQKGPKPNSLPPRPTKETVDTLNSLKPELYGERPYKTVDSVRK